MALGIVDAIAVGVQIEARHQGNVDRFIRVDGGHAYTFVNQALEFAVLEDDRGVGTVAEEYLKVVEALLVTDEGAGP